MDSARPPLFPPRLKRPRGRAANSLLFPSLFRSFHVISRVERVMSAAHYPFKPLIVLEAGTSLNWLTDYGQHLGGGHNSGKAQSGISSRSAK
jgi:hypothetical protein